MSEGQNRQQGGQQQMQEDQRLQEARDFFGKSLGRILGQMQSDSAQLQSYAQQVPEESQAQIRQMIDSYSQFEGTIDQTAQDAGVEEALQESAQQVRQNADVASGQDPTDVAAQQAQQVADKAQDTAGQATEQAGQVADQAQDAAGRATDQAGQVAEGVQDADGGLTGDQKQVGEQEGGDEQGDESPLGGVTDQAQDAAGQVTDRAQDVAGQATNQAGQLVGQAQDAVGGLIGGGQGDGPSGEQDMDEYSYSDSDATTVENDKSPKGLLAELLNLEILPSPTSDTTTLESGDTEESYGPEEAQQEEAQG